MRKGWGFGARVMGNGIKKSGCGLSILKSLAEEFSRRVQGARLSRTAGYLAYHLIWLTKFRYSAGIVGYTWNQLKEIQSW